MEAAAVGGMCSQRLTTETPRDSRVQTPQGKQNTPQDCGGAPSRRVRAVLSQKEPLVSPRLVHPAALRAPARARWKSLRFAICFFN